MTKTKINQSQKYDQSFKNLLVFIKLLVSVVFQTEEDV